MKTKTYFAFRIDVWDSSGDNLAEHLAGVEDYAMAVAAYWAAIQSRPKEDHATARCAGGAEKLDRISAPAGARPSGP